MLSVIVAVVIFIWSVYMLYRTNKVASAKQKMLDRCVPGKSDFMDRMAEHDEHGFNEMVWKFWKPVHSFYAKYLNERKGSSYGNFR